jgi:hypothetical protein
VDACSDCLRGNASCGSSTPGSLAAGDCVLSDGTFADAYRLDLAQGQVVRADLSSPDFDAFLYLVNDDCVVLATNDDCASGDFDSCLTAAPGPGTYYLVASSFAAGEDGDYTLDVDCDADPTCSGCVVGDIACGAAVGGNLDAADCALPADDSSVDVYRLVLLEPLRVSVELSSTAFDPFVWVWGEDCKVLASNDDCTEGDFSLSCLVVDLVPGTYYVGANSFSPGESGSYTLTVDCDEVNICDDCDAAPLTCGGTVNGTLEKGDCRLPADGTFVDLYRLELAEPARVRLSLAGGGGFTPAVFVVDATCQTLGVGGVCMPADPARACLTLDLGPGAYFVAAGATDAGEGGTYQLNAECTRDCGDSEPKGTLFCGLNVVGVRNAADAAGVDLYRLEVPVDGEVTLSLESTDFDSLLLLFSAECTLLAQNDFCTKGSMDACLTLELEAGSYFAGVDSAPPGGEGQYILSASCPDAFGQKPGDCNQDGSCDISDAVCLLGFLFLGSPTRLPCGTGTRDDPANRALLDWSGDGNVDISDAIAKLGFLFLGRPGHVLGQACTPIPGCAGICELGGP